MRYNVKEKIQEHYDLASPYYRDLWGKHLHHGYYATGVETKEAAAEDLIRLLVERAGVARGARVLDVGCGIGSTSIWLTENLGCKVTGITISPVQVRMATEASAHLNHGGPTFLIDDANDLTISGTFDVIWAVEVISHLSDRANFFRRASELLAPGGKICEAAWLKDEGISAEEEERFIRPIEEGMLVSLPDLNEYREHMEANGLRLTYYEDISPRVAKTWDICLDLIKDRSLWRLAYQHSREFVTFLKSFKAMRGGFKSGKFRYALMVSEKR